MAENTKKKKVFADAKSRNIFITVGVVAVGMVALSMMIGNSATEAPLESNTAAPEVTNSTPGQNTKPVYQQKVREQNEELASRAEQSGDSAIPTITNLGNQAEAPIFNPFEVTPEEQSEPEVVSSPVTSGSPISSQIRQQQTYQQPQAERQINPAMQAQMRTLMERWSGPLPSTQVTLNTTPSEAAQAATDASNNARAAAEAPAAPVEKKVKPMYRAGDIIPAVIDTELSTDYPGKVRATIVSGPLRGAYAIGDFTQQRDTVLLQFGTLSLPGKGSVSTEMVAVDPNTGNSGINSDVDYHYVSRYAALMGGILAKSMGVYAEMTIEEGSTTQLDANGNTIVTRPQRESNEKVIASLAGGAGEVADDMSDDIREGYNREPTVRVFQNEPVGLFVLTDIPENIAD